MRQPPLNSLRMFDAAARHLNFRLAAEELKLTQGAVAQQVRRVEADLEVQLFQRLPRGLALTAVGQDYHATVRHALKLIEQATIKLRPQNKSVVVSVTASFAGKWLVPRLNVFAKAHPDIDLQISASDSLADFRNDGVSFAIRQGEPPFGKGLDAKLLTPLQLTAVAAPQFAADLPIINDLRGLLPCALIQDSHKHWQQIVEAENQPNTPRIMQFNQTALATDAAVNGHGIALAPRLLLNQEIAEGKLVVIGQRIQEDDNGYYLVWPSAIDVSESAKATMQWFIDQISPSENSATLTRM